MCYLDPIRKCNSHLSTPSNLHLSITSYLFRLQNNLLVYSTLQTLINRNNLRSTQSLNNGTPPPALRGPVALAHSCIATHRIVGNLSLPDLQYLHISSWERPNPSQSLVGSVFHSSRSLWHIHRPATGPALDAVGRNPHARFMLIRPCWLRLEVSPHCERP